MRHEPTAFELLRYGLAPLVDTCGLLMLGALGCQVMFGGSQVFETEALWVGVVGTVACLVAPGAARRVPIPMLVYVAAALVSAAVHRWETPGMTWINLFRPALHLVVMTLFVFGSSHLLRTTARLSGFMVLLAGSICVVAVQLTFDRVATNFLDPRQTSGSQYQPSVVQWGGLHQSGMLLLLGLPIVASVALLARTYSRVLAGMLLAAGLMFAAYVNGSRSAVFVMILTAAAMASLTILKAGLGRWRGRLLLLAVGFVLAGLAYMVIYGRTTMPPITSLSGGRAPIWAAAWGMFVDHPWLGVGPGNYMTAMVDGGYAAKYLPWFPAQTSGVEQAHNMLVQVAAETGIIGLLGVLALWAWLLMATWRAWRSGQLPVVAMSLFFALAAFLARTMSDNFLDGLMTSDRTRVLVWMMFAAAVAVERLPRHVRQVDR